MDQQRDKLAPARRRSLGRVDLAAYHYQAIIESSQDAIVSKDLDGVILSWNRGAERLFGFTSEEAVGRPVTIIIPLDRLDEEPAILEKIHRGERIEHFETTGQRKDGSLVDISQTISPIRNAHGKIVGASKVARDITELRKARDRQDLRRSGHLLDGARRAASRCDEGRRGIRQRAIANRGLSPTRRRACPGLAT